MRESDLVLVCLSQRSASKDGFIQKEIMFALDRALEKPEGSVYVIPVRLEECNIPERLAKWHWVNLFDPNGYARLIKALRLRSGQTAPPPSPSETDELAKATKEEGDRLRGEGKWTEAVAAYDRAIYLSPDPEAYFGRGCARNILRNYLEAFQDLSRAVQLKPDYAQAYGERGSAYSYLGQYRRAIEDYDKAIDLKPDDASTYIDRNAAHYALGQYQRAIQDCDKAIHFKPDFALAYQFRGYAKHKLNDKAGAQADWEKAVALGYKP